MPSISLGGVRIFEIAFSVTSPEPSSGLFRFCTAVYDDNKDLHLKSWRVESDATITRLGSTFVRRNPLSFDIVRTISVPFDSTQSRVLLVYTGPEGLDKKNSTTKQSKSVEQ